MELPSTYYVDDFASRHVFRKSRFVLDEFTFPTSTKPHAALIEIAILNATGTAPLVERVLVSVAPITRWGFRSAHLFTHRRVAPCNGEDSGTGTDRFHSVAVSFALNN